MPAYLSIFSPSAFKCRESNWLHMMLCLPCVLWCSWGLRSRAMRWGPFATVSICAVFSYSLSKVSEDFQHYCFKGPSGSADVCKYFTLNIKNEKYHSQYTFCNVSYSRNWGSCSLLPHSCKNMYCPLLFVSETTL